MSALGTPRTSRAASRSPVSPCGITSVGSPKHATPSLMARDRGPLSKTSSKNYSRHASTKIEAKARPSARTRTRAPPCRREKTTEKIIADQSTPRWSPRLITRASSPSRTFRATSISSWRAHALTTPTLSNTSTRTTSSSNVSYDRPVGQKMGMAKWR